MLRRVSDRLKYTGPAPCAGCSIPGTEVPRTGKDNLCQKCKELLILGRELQKDFKEKDYMMACVTWYKLEFYNSKHGGSDIDSAFHKIFRLLHRRGLDYHNSINLTKIEATTHHENYVMRTEYANAFKELIDALATQQNMLRDEFKEVEKLKEQVVKKERNKIYNQGLKDGRNLLLQLNKGQITLEDFEKDIIKY